MADDGDAERLVVLLEARITDYEKNLKKASGTTTTQFAGMRRTAASASRQMEADVIASTTTINRALASVGTKVGGLGIGLAASALAPIAALLTLGAAINGTRAALDKFGDIADKSAAAGVDPEFFQGIAEEAKLSGVDIDGVASSLATFAKNAGLAAEGKGRMVSTLQALDPELLRNIQLATTQEQRVRLVADAIKNAKDQAQAAAIASAAFGDEGVKLVSTFGQGGAAIDGFIQKGKEAGKIVDTELVQRADALGDKLDSASSVVDTQLKKALINLGPVLLTLEGYIGDWLKLLNVALDQLNTIDQRTTLNPLQNQLIGVENAIVGLKDEIDKLKEGAATRGQGGNVLDGVFGSDAEIAAKQKKLADLYIEAAQLQERIDELQGKPKSSWGPSWVTAPAAGAGDDPTAGLGVAPTTFDFRAVLDKTKAKADQTTRAVVDTSDAVTELSKNWQTAEQMAESFGSAFISDMRSGKSVVESLTDSLGDLAGALEQMVVDQGIKSLFSALSGGLTGGFGSIKGGAAIPTGGFIPGITGPKLFASGGVTSEPAIFGDNGPEAAVPLPDGRSIPVTLRGGAGGSAPVINLTFVNQTAAPIAVREGPGQPNQSGGVDQQMILTTVDAAGARNLQRGGTQMRTAMTKTFGLRPQLTRR